MDGFSSPTEESLDSVSQSQQHAPPSISIPKGGGAIRGIDEKFQVNPATGTASLTVPIVTSPGRSAFGPQLALSYDSGAGNGPFGFGWSLSLPSVTRKTDKGLPLYGDAEESDTFILSDAEDLVPVLEEKKDGDGEGDAAGELIFHERTIDGYTVRRYRPRIEGLFARIERWTNESDPEDVRWRSMSKDNVTTWYGRTAESRIVDPRKGTHIFSWLICQSYDDKGNAIVYEYLEENSERIFEDDAGNQVSLAYERNRTDGTRKVNRYLKCIKYGNRRPNRDGSWNPTDPALLSASEWMFEVVFDYGEGHYIPEPNQSLPDQHEYVQATRAATGEWPVRRDPFSSYKAGFEVRTYRLCRRVLMFHYFPAEPGPTDYLVRSTDFAYEEGPIASYIIGVTQSGYVHKPTQSVQNRYLKKSLPPLEFEYSRPVIHHDWQEIDPESLENLPQGVDGAQYRFVDLDGEGLSGVLSEQAGAWSYKPNLGGGRFGAKETVAQRPSLAALNGGGQQLLDLAGDGQLDLAAFQGPTPGFYERTFEEDWASFRTFTSLPNLDWNDSNLRFVDLTGDGHADILITEDDAFTWHLSLAEEGFGEAERTHVARDEEEGPRLIFADGTQSIYLADLSGDGLTDLARVCDGEVSYWPSLGHNVWGAKVTMHNAPRFDHPELIDQRRIHLADIDGSGTTDIIFLGRDGISIYRNQAGNSWSAAELLDKSPKIEDLSSVMVVDLLGNGTACLVWSSGLPGDQERPLFYIDLMADGKPHLLISSVNNLGAETRVHYASSTKFYIADKLAGRPWITRLPFPVHVVERVETYDRISRNRFVTRYAYHHGFYDGQFEREFRGFGMVEQWDTEEFAALSDSGEFPSGDNIEATSHVPPVHTKTWFHTGVYLGRDRVSDFFAGLLDAEDRGEYFREPDWRDDDAEARSRLLDDTVFPQDVEIGEEHEASRALKGAILRQELYAEDGSPEAGIPYTVSERNYTIKVIQSRGRNRHAVFFTHPRESINTHYERDPRNPRVQHELVLEADAFGNVVKSAAVGYGRNQSDLQKDQGIQMTTLITFTENTTTNSIEDNTDDNSHYPNDYRAPVVWQTRTYELTGFDPPAGALRIGVGDLGAERNGTFILNFDDDISYESQATSGRRRRLIEHTRTRFRQDDLSAPLSFGELAPLALPHESYQLALTPGLLTGVYSREGDAQPEPLLPNQLRATVLGGRGSDQGGYVDLVGDGNWWVPSGRIYYHPDPDNPLSDEPAEARQNFYLPRLFRDPFGNGSIVTYDNDYLLPVRTQDATGNVVASQNDYRVLQPELITDPNGNQSEVKFDALGLAVATTVMGKPGENVGGSLIGMQEDLTQAEIDRFFADPKGDFAETLLGGATTRFVYDVARYARLNDPNAPTYAATLARETHLSDALPADGFKLQVTFSFSDGLGGREIQQKIQAEPGPLVPGGTEFQPRWTGSGWTVFNNKGKPVRQYEPFFSATHDFEFARLVGVSPILFYDPLERVVATLHPNGAWEKVSFDVWRQETWDVNDTVLSDPKSDPDVGDFFSRLLGPERFDSWYERRIGGARGSREQSAAHKAAAHADTPTLAHFDALGRAFLTVADNGLDNNGDPILHRTRLVLDIEGNQREVKDERTNKDGDLEERLVMRYDYDMLSNQLHQASMEAGERWTLNNVASNSIRAWNSRRTDLKSCYDARQRPTHHVLWPESNQEILVERMIYGEAHPDAGRNLRGQLYQHYDGAGLLANERFDFKGNLLESRRQLTGDQRYRQTMDWGPLRDLADLQAIDTAAGALLDPNDDFVSHTRYDALNRPVQLVSPHSATLQMQPNVIQPAYNEANLLERIDVWLSQSGPPGQLLDGTTATFSPVANIDYNARGQRERIDYGNQVTTTYEYDPETFRLILIRTTRTAGSNGLASQLFANPTTVQELRYTYDPVGNISNIADNALAGVIFNNVPVDPVLDYVYDAVYRLVRAEGREHIGQTAFDFAPQDNSFRDYPFVGSQPHANDLKAMRNYSEDYYYDEVGNIKRIRHNAAGGGWTRFYEYLEPSLLEPPTQTDPGRTNNRLTLTTVSGTPETYNYSDVQERDVHGCMTAINAMGMAWDYADQLQAVDLGGGGTAHYVYDAAGQRVRKVIKRQNGTRQRERIYLGGFEIYREYNGATGAKNLERETLHIIDDERRIALVESRTAGSDPAPAHLIRYQLGNHLGSAALELDGSGQLISYEEYTPYGSTSFQAARSTTETPKRYRYTGKERDEESGFYYYGARFYAPWLGRWISCDQDGFVDGLNLYQFVSGNPIKTLDLQGDKGITVEQLESMKRRTAARAVKLKDKLAENNFGSRKEALKTARQAEAELLALEETGFWESLNPFVGIPNHFREVSAKTRLAQARYDLVPVEERIGIFTYSPVVSAVAEHVAWGAAGNVAPITHAGRNITKGLEKRLSNRIGKTTGKAAAGPSIRSSARVTRQGSRATATAADDTVVQASKVLIGTDRAQFRKDAAKLIGGTPGHPLKFLIDKGGKLKSAFRKKHHEMIGNPDWLEMGHVVSAKSGEAERIVLQSGWTNQFDRITVEGLRGAGAYIENVAVNIGGVGVEQRTAIDWVKKGLLRQEVLDNAARIVF